MRHNKIISKKRNSNIISWGIIFFCVLVLSGKAYSQTDLPFSSGEQLKFTIRYKYGILMVKAGSAEYKIKEQAFKGSPMIRASLSFRTNSTFDKIYKIRDTLYSYSKPSLEPVFHQKHLNEGKTQYTEEIHYKHFSPTFTSVQSKRYSDDDVKFDKILTSDGVGYDMLNIFMFARTLDYKKLQTGDSFPLTSFVGRDAVPMKARYMGQTIIDKGNIKYKTHLFEIDITDTAFSEQKTAMEMWISDDENRVPVKLRAKLKIGAAEAELSSTKGLKYPFSSKIEIPQK